MAAAHELLVVQAEDGVVAVQEVRVEDDLDAVGRGVEQLHAADLVQDRVVRVVGHVVRRHGRERVPLQREDAPLEEHLVFVRQQVVGCRKGAVFAAGRERGTGGREETTYPLELMACSKRRAPMRFWISVTVSWSCFVTAWPLSASIVYECVVAGMIMNAITVILDPDFLRR